MVTALQRIQSEREFHDRQAAARAASLARNEKLWDFDPDAYLDHASWIRPAMDRLGPVAGRAVLDFGCGHGMAALVLAGQGAWVTAFDLSTGYLGEARQRASANRLPITFVSADGERLPFADRSFDRIWGNAILHHLDLNRTAPELFRVLRPGGIAVFCEPWGGNPLLRWARRWLPYPGKHRTRDEEPLRPADIATLKRWFPDLHWEGYELLSMLQRLKRSQGRIATLGACDRRILTCAPGLRNYCRYVVLTLRKP